MNTENHTNNKNFASACQFIIKLGKAAHGYGSTAGRLENYLTRMTEALGYRGAFRVSSTEMISAFQEDENQPQQMHMTILPGAGLDLSKLALVGDLVDDIEQGRIAFSDGSGRLDAIGKTPVPWGKVASGISYALVGAGLAVLFSLGWWDVFFSTIFSIVVYAMVLFSGSFGQRAAEWLPLTSAFVVAALTTLTRFVIPELNLVMVVLAAIAVLLPGYTISLGLIELVSRHVVSGTAHLMSGLVYLAKQLAGAWLGAALVIAFLPDHTTTAAIPVTSGWLWLFMPLVIIGLCVIFQTSKRDLFSACFGCAIAYGGILLGSAITGGNLGNLLGTIIAVVFANLWARKTGRPTSIVLLPAIILLVSGSIGFRGLAAMAAGQVASGEQQVLQMFVVAFTIAAGLLVGNTIVPSKTTL